MSERPTYQPDEELVRKPFNIPPTVEVFDLQRELAELHPLVSPQELKRKRDKAFGKGGEHT